MKESGRMKIGELVARSGVPRHMIHYYLNQGVLHPPERVNRTTAYYDESHLERLKMIRKVKRDFNSPLAFIMSQFEEPGGQSPAPASSRSEGRSRKHAAGDSEKKERIIRAAIELFSTRGYHRTGVKDITDSLGCSTGTFYLYFESKRDLFNQAVARAVKNTVDEVETSVGKEKDFFARNTRRLEALKSYYPKFSEILTQLRAETFTSEWTGQSVGEVYYEISKPFIQEMRRALDLGLIRPVDPDLLVFCVIGMCDTLLMRLSLDNKYDLGQVIAFMFDVMLNGLRPNREPS